MEDIDSLNASDEDDDEDLSNNSMDGFLVDDDYNSEEDMDFMPKKINL